MSGPSGSGAAAPTPTARLAVSCGALIFDSLGRLLVLKPTYKAGWTLPGGQMEADGESPWDACRREVSEECGVDVPSASLACVDFLRSRPGKPGGLRFLFDCGSVPDDTLARLTLPPDEIADYRLADVVAAQALLSGPLRRRVQAAIGRRGVVYLEDGLPVPTVPQPPSA
ncbi:MAG TPA: NUDIX hydrolase [Acidimicrobiales bacterium]|nr:NUDIX hydrolase [Acidimicrobiales bacterium]